MKSKKKKVLHIIQSLGNGGWENVLLRILPLLSDGFDHEILTLNKLGELAPEFIEKGMRVTTIEQKSLLDMRSYGRLLTKVKQSSPDIIITYLFHADLIGRFYLQPSLYFFLRRKSRLPIIPFLGTTYNFPRYRLARIFERFSKPFVYHYLANSPAVKDFYVKNIGVSEKKITVMPTGLDSSYFSKLKRDASLQQSLHLESDDFVVICVANLHHNKGHRFLLEAFEQLYVESPAEKRQKMKLLIVGEGAENQNLHDQASAYASAKNIIFLGRRSDVPSLLKLSTCFVLPTLFEGMSNAIMEAMAAGLPVITTDIPENRELVIGGKSGLLVAPQNAGAIKEALDTLLKNDKLRVELGENAQQRIREHFDIGIVVSDLSSFLNSLKVDETTK